MVSFLTIFPVGKGGDDDDLSLAARYMYAFPVVGLLIGLFTGVIAFVLQALLPRLLAGILALGAILLVTGVHHTDGLLDFGDGVMCKGTRDRKIEAMRDKLTGAGGYSLALVVLLTTALSISYLPSQTMVLSLISSESSAKASMVLAAGFGRSATQGTNTIFIQSMHDKYRAPRLVFSVPVALAAGMLSSYLGLVSVIAALLSSLLLVRVADHSFGGLTGDVFGAINDITRMVSLLVLVGGFFR